MKYIRMFPDVEYSTDRDFFLENQIVCIVSREGTKFCSLIENRSCVPKAAISASGCSCISCVKSTRKSAAFAMAASRWNDLPHPTPEYFLSKKSGNPYAVARLFSIFAGLNQKKKVIRLKNLNDNILE